VAEDTAVEKDQPLADLEPMLPADGGRPDSANFASGGVIAFGDYTRSYVAKVRSGDSGLLPVVIGLIVIAAAFQISNSHFLTALNLVNLLEQGSIFMLLALGVIFVLVIGEIDLSVGYVAGLGGIIAGKMLTGAHPWPTWMAIIVPIIACGAIGFLQGSLITRIGLPSFIVTLAGFLGWNGVMLIILGNGGTIPINNNVFDDFANANLSVTVGWVLIAALVVLYAAMLWQKDGRRRKSGLVAPPVGLTILKIVVVALAGIALALICNTNRSQIAIASIQGIPWVVFVVLAMLLLCTFILTRTRLGRYMYAIGGNTEAARRAGVNTALIRTLSFTLCSAMGGVAGIIYAGQLRGVSTNVDGGQLVLYAIAAAVIGGTSLFGGRGKAVHAVIGGLVVASIANGMGLLELSAASEYVVTGLVLLAAVTVDALTHRRASAT
jgi:D-xylose transport system permease protein